MNRRGKKRADLLENLFKSLRKSTRAYGKKETMDMIKLKYSEMWTSRKSQKEKELELSETSSTDAGKEVYYIVDNSSL
ncbi:uncharacterized protein NEMAJ01_0281 [Nematocida major]|uniref:uncharacterized protein n=1 Tax=Nematocida major TaxID=1912982 RepID=UPI0020074F74|nr:uncharacterized protein NEMAJ01_0281 [Nematocida major]KAH9385385.1 hypothetical protein NEMAJ01_0281 [Nematocida major]